MTEDNTLVTTLSFETILQFRRVIQQAILVNLIKFNQHLIYKHNMYSKMYIPIYTIS